MPPSWWAIVLAILLVSLMLATLEVFTIWCVVMGYVLIYFNVQFWFSAKTLRAF